MKILGRIDGSIYGAIRSHSSVSRAIQSAAHGQHGANHHNLIIAAVSSLSCPSRSLRRTRSESAAPVCAGTNISNSAYSTITTPNYRRPSNSISFTSHTPQKRNQNHTSSAAAAAVEPYWPVTPCTLPSKSREELLSFLDYYDEVTVEEQLEFLRDPYRRGYAPAAVQPLRLSEGPHDYFSPSPEELEMGDQEVQQTLSRLRSAITQKLLRANSISNDDIYDVYRSLPEPRMHYLSGRQRHALFAALGATERKNAKDMLRYFAVVADVKNAGFSLTRTEWNTALSFASRYVGASSQTETEAALHLWREMEHDAGISGNEVTFNILFDVAAKAGKFALAEMTYQEMITRGHHFNRYHHVSLIHYFGLKLDSSGMRAAYKAMVDNGEVIDTRVLNCVISGFLRCGEETSAEFVYHMMKKSDDRSKLIPQRDYSFNKMVNKVLLMFSRLSRKHPDLSDGPQSATALTPDLATYRILLNYYGVRLGQMSQVVQFLDEMKFFRVPLHGSVFLALFKAFSIHGGNPNTAWSVKRLVDVWHAFLDAFDGGANGLYINTWMAMWVLRAFAICTDSKEEVLAVYEELRARWPADDGTDAFMLDFLHNLISEKGWGPNNVPLIPM
ncbi:hypothetical protein PFICI_08818 [Pestalotiopsis fici W106-1]|uniref:Pentacotripeptide-repeat region of PRORP domain-containing protein n=1 Tax=Pestalotiopsis fici (strain W106-1 / CGMCC3.15140) TaxID=1229662 RepID=W3WYN6_PESFW|nr:uncharacterized protein PFICI_08818 [Pestalotiopsis fici W106-1]ETS78965.1 hypothetical protein PFICI_08818 [Pestalotiopsis fici W106-1]